MSCKIVDDPKRARPYAWRVVGEPPPRDPEPGPDQPQIAGDVVELRRRITDLESARHREASQIREAAFREGQQKGREEAAAEVGPVLQNLAATLAELAGLRRKIRAEAESDVVKLALAIAKRILHRELVTDASAIHGLVHAALAKLQNREIHRVRVHPSFVSSVRECLERMGAAPAIEIVADTTLRRGDAVFETALGELDASVESQLQEIERGFADRLAPR
ncbi:MAG TPA: FliH/SctL family protein [Bryobacteraceae bacterium]|nr:FliH/SctL family protein [Bryobacteraceae bacterium]